MRGPTIIAAVLSVILLACSAASPRPAARAAPAATVDIQAAAMLAHLQRIAEAQAAGELEALRDELETAAKDRKPWSVTRAAWAQISVDADGAWNRLREVTIAAGDQGGAAYWAHVGMAQVYLAWEVQDQARGELERALEIAPDTGPALARLGELQELQGDTDAAVATWTRAVEVSGGAAGAPRAAIHLARVHLAAARLPEAGALVDGVLEAYPTHVDALLLASDLAAAGEGGPAAAIPFLERAAQASPADVDLFVRLAKAQEAAGDPQGALAAWQSVTVARPGDLEAWRAQARLGVTVGDAGAERSALAQISRIDQADLDALRRLAELQVQAAEPAEAETSLTELLGRKADDVPALLARAGIRETQGNLRLALGDLRAAAAAGSDEGGSRFETIARRLGLPEKPVKGSNPDAIYRAVVRVVWRTYERRLETLPRLGGAFAIKVKVEGGKVIDAEIVDNTLHDPDLEAVIYWTVMDAAFPALAGRREYNLPFTFTPPDR